ncbi:hypothetical protein TIFTF001_003306 [Ficus carica]|uniref:Uncharacterized protein n=1 Tax=Ficus carica TaxID=3494 RepID=A0AA87ZCQ9_FICCA|nr:hypothetical protein TIFTF001_003306 [Ficus carica]
MESPRRSEAPSLSPISSNRERKLRNPSPPPVAECSLPPSIAERSLPPYSPH